MFVSLASLLKLDTSSNESLEFPPPDEFYNEPYDEEADILSFTV